MGILVIIIIVFLCIYIKVVPANTVIIVDRNSHYLKTKKSGIYFFNPSTDKITTQISMNRISKTYVENFETHDGEIVKVAFHVSYHAENLEDVLVALESVRRSIDDIMNSSVYWAVHNLSIADFFSAPSILKKEVAPKLLSEATELKINVDSFDIISINKVPANSEITPFKPHLNSHSAGPIKFN